MTELNIKLSDGTCPAELFRPATGTDRNRRSGVILFMDAMGPRLALHEMAKRMSDAGYVVLLPDLFYREGRYGPFDGRSFLDPEKRVQILSLMQATTFDMTLRDTEGFLDALVNAGANGAMAAVGYCMGGARALKALAAYPDRIAFAASFHGGNLASEASDSPHLDAPRIAGRAYIATAETDPSFPLEQSVRLAGALREAGVDHIIENFRGMSHGWTIPDHHAFDDHGAERHWTRLVALLDESLAMPNEPVQLTRSPA